MQIEGYPRPTCRAATIVKFACSKILAGVEGAKGVGRSDGRDGGDWRVEQAARSRAWPGRGDDDQAAVGSQDATALPDDGDERPYRRREAGNGEPSNLSMSRRVLGCRRHF